MTWPRTQRPVDVHLTLTTVPMAKRYSPEYWPAMGGARPAVGLPAVPFSASVSGRSGAAASAINVFCRGVQKCLKPFAECGRIEAELLLARMRHSFRTLELFLSPPLVATRAGPRAKTPAGAETVRGKAYRQPAVFVGSGRGG